MAASARDLIEAVRQRALMEAPDEAAGIATTHAIGQLARVPVQFVAHEPTIEQRSLLRHHVAATALATESSRASRAWPAREHRLVDLAGVAADAILLEFPHRSQDERWAAVVETARAISACASLAQGFKPFARIPELQRVHRLAGVVAVIGARESSPRPQHAAWLDRPVAARAPAEVTDLDAAAQVVESISDLTRMVAARGRDETLSIRHLLAVAAAAELCCRDIARLAEPAPDAVDSARAAADGWQVVQAALVRLDDGSHRSTGVATRIFDNALNLQRQVTDLADDLTCAAQHAGSPPARAAGARRAAQSVANQLPNLARISTEAIAGNVRRGLVLARAGAIARGAYQPVDALPPDRVVVVEPAHIGPVLRSTRIAERLSIALAVQLDRAFPTSQPQPVLARSHVRDFRPTLFDSDADWSRRIAARVDAFDVAAMVPGRRTALV